MKFICLFLLVFTCFSSFAQVQWYELEPASTDSVILLSENGTGEFDTVSLKRLPLSAFLNDLSLSGLNYWEKSVSDNLSYMDGNVGVGIADAIWKFQVYERSAAVTMGAHSDQSGQSANVQIMNDSDESLLLSHNGSAATGSAFDILKAGTSTIVSDGDLAIGTQLADDLVLGTDNSARLEITGTGSIKLTDFGGSGDVGLKVDNSGVIGTTPIIDGSDYLQISDTAAMLVNYALNSDVFSGAYGDLTGTPTIPDDTWTDGGSFVYSNENIVSINTSSSLGANLNVVGTSRWEFPAGVINYNSGTGNLASTTTGSNNVAYGSFNLATSTLPSYNFATGVSNARYATTLTNNAFFGESNALNATVSNISLLSGKENAQNSSDIKYSVLNGFRNFQASTGTVDASLINGYLNAGLATGNTRNSLIIGTQNVYNKSDAVTTVTAIGIYNAFNSPTVDNGIFIGQSNGRYNTGALNKSILLGFEQAYSSGTGAPYRLHIGMYRNSPLIYGEFDNDLVRVNGDLEVEQSGAVASTASIINGTQTWNILNTGASGDLVIEPQTIDGDVIFRDQTNDEWLFLDNTDKKITIEEDDLVPTSETDMRIAGLQDDGTNRQIVSVGLGEGLFYDSTTDEIASTFVSPNPGVFTDASLIIGSPTYEAYAVFTETIDLSSNYTIAGDSITVADEGVYFFAIGFEPSVIGGTTLNRVTLEINNANHLERDYDELAQTITMTGYVNLSAGDRLKLSIQQFPNGGIAEEIEFTIHRVGIVP